ncbi:phenylacetate--CoA ligase family protein [Streptomyces sp. NPDC001732]
MGLRPGDVVMHAFVLNMWIAGLGPLDVLQNFGATTVPIGAEKASRFAAVARHTKPVAAFMTPSYAEYLLHKIPEEAGVDPAGLGIRRIALSGEPGAGVPEIRERISRGFGGAEIYDGIGATGAVFKAAISCEAHEGMHFVASDYTLFEVLDPSTLQPLPLEDGVEGEVVLTGLEKECAPLVRWRDKDRVRVHTKPCACGRPGFRIEVLGRSDDMLLVRGVNVYPHAIKDVVTSFAPRVTGNICVVLDAAPPVAPAPLPLLVEVPDGVTDEPYSARASSRRFTTGCASPRTCSCGARRSSTKASAGPSSRRSFSAET